jgi:hypothetical protein
MVSPNVSYVPRAYRIVIRRTLSCGSNRGHVAVSLAGSGTSPKEGAATSEISIDESLWDAPDSIFREACFP